MGNVKRNILEKKKSILSKCEAAMPCRVAIRDLDPQGSSSLTSKFEDFQGQGQPILKFSKSSQGLKRSKIQGIFKGKP